MLRETGVMNIECPATMRRHVQKVLGGEYEVPYRATRPVILDVGANVGSFAAWALKRWPGAHVHCYEPLPENFALLKKNLGSLEGQSISLNNFAIGDPSLKISISAATIAGRRASTMSASNRRPRSRSRPGRQASCPRRTS
jgi:FkbM family methyltransferase